MDIGAVFTHHTEGYIQGGQECRLRSYSGVSKCGYSALVQVRERAETSLLTQTGTLLSHSPTGQTSQ